MIILYRENGVLYANSVVDKIISPEYKNIVKGSFDPQMIDVDVCHKLIKRNESVSIETTEGFVKPNLYDLEMALMNKTYKTIDVEKIDVKKPNKKIVETVQEDVEIKNEEIIKELETNKIEEKPEVVKKQRHQK